jgi:hypothetical protein
MTAVLTDALLAAAREYAIASLEPRRAEAPPPRPRARRARGEALGRSRPRSPVSQPREEAAGSAPVEAPSDLVITDPQALLAALEIGEPAGSVSYAHSAREAPGILQPAEPPEPAPVPAVVPALRAGEEIMRTSAASGVILRRRRV